VFDRNAMFNAGIKVWEKSADVIGELEFALIRPVPEPLLLPGAP
jgi:hypothetical protein